MAVLLCILSFAGTPVLGGPLVVRDVIQVLGVGQNPVSLRVQNTHTASGILASGIGGSPTGRIDITQGLSSSADSPDNLFSGLSVPQSQEFGIDIADGDEVDGTICDCGETFVAGAGFPKWPLLFLAAIPLLIPHDDDNPEDPTPTPTPTPTPPPTPTPEPATLLLFGSGLAAIGAGIRRRRARQNENHLSETKES
jgi:hypothetical protein